MNRLKKGSVFTSFLRSYIIMLGIVLLGWIMVMTMLDKHINNQSDRLNEYMMQTTSKDCDEYFYRLRDAVYTIWRKSVYDYDEILGKNMFSNTDYYDAKKYSSLISDKVSFDEYHINTGVYYYKTDNMMSELGLCKSKQYFDLQYGKSEEYYKEWMSSLTVGSGYFISNAGDNHKILTYCLDCSGKGTYKRDVIIFAEMDLNIITDKLDMINYSTEGKVIAFDKQGAIISSMSEQEAEKFLDKALQHRKGTQIIQSDSWNYAFNFGGWELSKEYYILFTVQILITIIGLFAAVVYAWNESKKHYKPIMNLVNKIKMPFDSEGGRNVSEFDFLGEGIDNLSQMNTFLDTESLKARKLIKKQLLTKLLLGIYDSQDVKLLNKYYPWIGDKYAVVAIINPLLTAEIQRQFDDTDIDAIFTNIFEELINNVCEGTIVNINELYYCIIKSNNDNLLLFVKDILEQGIKSINQYFHISFTAAVSNVVSKVENIYEAAGEAEIALQLINMGIIESQTVFCKELVGIKTEDAEYKRISTKLTNCLVSGDYTGACKLVDQMFVVSMMNGDGFESVRMKLILELTYIIQTLIPNSNAAIREKFDPVKVIMKSKDFETMREIIYKYIEDVIEIVNNYGEQDDLADKISKYIEDNYANPELSAGKISEHFNYHPVYMSRKFKEKRNETILSYIIKVRLENAKRMLRESNDTIESIALKSGYANINTFNRVFKKEEGITPSVYRRNNKHM